MKKFHQTINYSSSNEDSNSEILSLDIKKMDHILCITGSGARCLDLLIREPQKIVSIDFNPCQNFLLELKMAAIKKLDYPDFIRFLGVKDSLTRTVVYNKLKDELSEAAREFWEQNIRIIEKGVIFQGRWGKYFRLLSLILRLTRPRLLSRLFENISIGKQKMIWLEEWNDWLWHKFMQTIGEKVFWKYLLKDPGFYKYVPDNFDVHDYLIQKFNQAIQTLHFRRSAFLSILFWGRFIDGADLPLYLQRENFDTLKRNIHKIEIVTSGLNEYLQNCENCSFDKYSLSDFSSYTNEIEYYDIWHNIIEKARPQARFCERQFLVKRDIPVQLKHNVRRNDELEKELAKQDASVFYTFLTGQIMRPLQ